MNRVPRQLVYGHFVYDTWSTDISSTTVYQRTGLLYIQLPFQQIIIFINSNFYLHYDSFFKSRLLGDQLCGSMKLETFEFKNSTGVYDENDEREFRCAEKRNHFQTSNAYPAVIHVQVPHHSSTRCSLSPWV